MTYAVLFRKDVSAMKRMAMIELLAWKEARRRKPLLVTGVRHCGKTYLLRHFGETHFPDFAYLNLEQNPQIASVYDVDLNPKRILNDLSNAILRRSIVPGRTLLVLDEIQAVPKAITALKYFSEEMPSLHIIGAGSLLGVSLRKGEASFPVGKVDHLQLRPMGFRELVWACGQETLQKSLEERNLQEELPPYYVEPLTKTLLNYYLVGGMPEAVTAWVETQDFNEVRQVQTNILSGYAADFAKHAPPSEFEKLDAIWQAIPAQLAKDNGKFVFSRVKKSARAKDLEASIQCLVDAGLIHLLKKVDHAQIPLSAHADNSYYKVYACDSTQTSIFGCLSLRRYKTNFPPITCTGEAPSFSHRMSLASRADRGAFCCMAHLTSSRAFSASYASLTVASVTPSLPMYRITGRGLAIARSWARCFAVNSILICSF